NDAEAATDKYRYRAFGLDAHTQGSSTNPFTFIGQKGYYRDLEIDLYFVRARYYDYATGRWVNEDPIGYRSGDTNLYRYVFNNPLNGVDPSGNGLFVEDSPWGNRARDYFKGRLQNECAVSVPSIRTTYSPHYWYWAFGTYYLPQIDLMETFQ